MCSWEWKWLHISKTSTWVIKDTFLDPIYMFILCSFEWDHNIWIMIHNNARGILYWEHFWNIRILISAFDKIIDIYITIVTTNTTKLHQFSLLVVKKCIRNVGRILFSWFCDLIEWIEKLQYSFLSTHFWTLESHLTVDCHW